MYVSSIEHKYNSVICSLSNKPYFINLKNVLAFNCLNSQLKIMNNITIYHNIK